MKPGKHDVQILRKSQSCNPAVPMQDFKNKTVIKPWGFEYLLFENNDVAIWVLKLRPAASTSMHAHVNKTTSLLVVGGTAVCSILGGKHHLSDMEAVILGKGVFHKTSNTGEKDLFLLEIESPVDKYDLVRHQDDYGREGGAYEAADSIVDSPDTYLKHGTVYIGNSAVSLCFADSQQSFLRHIEQLSGSIVTILDRHVWSSDGEKLIEVGKSFKPGDVSDDIMINDGFHYLVIHAKSECEG